jgi:hypothetical protein
MPMWWSNVGSQSALVKHTLYGEEKPRLFKVKSKTIGCKFQLKDVGRRLTATPCCKVYFCQREKYSPSLVIA